MAPISSHIVNYLVNPVKGEKKTETIKNAARPKLDESRFSVSASGGEEEIRTLDPHVANVMLYQLSYFPIRGNRG